MKTPSDNNALDPADRHLIDEIRTLAIALWDGPSRWDLLHARVAEAKERKLHRKLRLRWAEFLKQFGLSEDDWSRVRVAVDICTVLRKTGLPLPTNHAQLDELRFLRHDPTALVAFWKKVIREFGSVPPARLIAALKGGKPFAASSKPQSAARLSVPAVPSQLAQLASSYVQLMQDGELFAAHQPAQQLAALILGTPIAADAWRIWPSPKVPERQLEIPIDDARAVPPAKSRRGRRSRLRPGLQGQLLLDFIPAALVVDANQPTENFREIRGSLERGTNPDPLDTDGAVEQIEFFREIRGNLEAAKANLDAVIPVLVPDPESFQRLLPLDVQSVAAGSTVEDRETGIGEIPGNMQNALVGICNQTKAAPTSDEALPPPPVKPSSVAPRDNVICGQASLASREASKSTGPDAELGALDAANAVELGNVCAPVNSNKRVTTMPSGLVPARTDSILPIADQSSPTLTMVREWGKKIEPLPIELLRDGAQVASELSLEGGAVRLKLSISTGSSRWASHCPTPPKFSRAGDAPSISFEKLLPKTQPQDLRDETDFAVKYLTSNGNLGLLIKFVAPRLVADAQTWLAERGPHNPNAA